MFSLGEAEAQNQELAKKDEFIGKLVPLETFMVNLAGGKGSRNRGGREQLVWHAYFRYPRHARCSDGHD